MVLSIVRGLAEGAPTNTASPRRSPSAKIASLLRRNSAKSPRSVASAASTAVEADQDPSASLFEDSTTSLWEESVGSGRLTPPYLRPELSEGINPRAAQQEVAAAQAAAVAKLAKAREAAERAERARAKELAAEQELREAAANAKAKADLAAQARREPYPQPYPEPEPEYPKARIS